MLQKTLKRSISCTGTGLHSGKPVSLVLRPAAEDTGIVFHVTTADGKYDFSATPHTVVATALATTIGDGNVSVSTVEHLLAALRGLEVDNVNVHVQGCEIPIMDGSAEPFVDLIKEAGVVYQRKHRKVLKVDSPVSFETDGKFIRAEPYDGFFVDYTIDFPHPAIGKQRLALEINADTFEKIASARTFGFMRDVQALQEAGMALGGSLENAIVLDQEGVMNQEGLRQADEFVRHKLLDFVGDMAMLELPLQGRFEVCCSGHALNNRFLCHLVDNSLLRRATLGLQSGIKEVIPAARDSRPVGMPIPALG